MKKCTFAANLRIENQNTPLLFLKGWPKAGVVTLN